MSFLRRLLGPPELRASDFADYQKVAAFVTWCLDNDPVAKEAVNPAVDELYHRGYRPMAGWKTDPTSIRPFIIDVCEWVTVQVYMVLNLVQAAPQDEWCIFLSVLYDKLAETTESFSQWGKRAGMDLETLPTFDLNLVAVRLSSDAERIFFYQEYFSTMVLAAELRVYGLWYRHRYGRWPRNYSQDEVLQWCEREGRLPAFMEAMASSDDVPAREGPHGDAEDEQ